MRTLLILLVACSAAEPRAQHAPRVSPPVAVTPSRVVGSSLPRAEVTLEELLSDDVNGVGRFTPDLFPPLVSLDSLADPSQGCWAKLRAQLVAGYHVFLPSETEPSQRDAYFITEGTLSRDETEQCASLALKRFGLEIGTDGDLTIFRLGTRSAYAAWRGRFIIFGGRRQVVAALRTSTHETVARWRSLLGQMPHTAFMWLVSVDQRASNLSAFIGQPFTSIDSWIDKMERAPRPLLGGTFSVHYATPAAAAKSAAWIKSWIARGEFPFAIKPTPDVTDLYKRMAKALGALTLTQEGTRLQVKWDSDAFGGVDNINAFLQLADQRIDALHK